jgi:WD40 repeat protein
VDRPTARRSIGGGWTQTIGTWDPTITIAPSGEVLAVEGSKLHVLATEDGRELRSLPVCSPADRESVRFANESTLVVACLHDGWQAYSWPELQPRGGANLKNERIEHAAIGADLVAAIVGRRRVRIWSVTDFTLVDWFDVPGEVTAIALSPSGGALAISTDEEVLVRDVASQSSRTLVRRHAKTGLSFSPDGRRLAMGFDHGAMEIDLTGAVLRELQPKAWLNAVTYLSDDVVAATDAGGLYVVEGNAHRRLDERLGESLAVSANGQRLCAGGGHGLVRCYDTKGYERTPAPVRLAALPRKPPPPERLDPLVDDVRGARPTATAPAGASLVWSIYGNAAGPMAIASSGEVVTSRGGTIQVHAKDDGHMTGKAVLCRDDIVHLSFTGPGRLFFVCWNEAGFASYPAVKVLATHPIQFVDRIAVGGGRVAMTIATKRGQSLVIRALDTWKQLDEIKGVDPREDLAISLDGKTLAYAAHDGVRIRSIASRKERTLAIDGRGLALSSDGKRIFSGGSQFNAVEYATADGTQQRVWEAGTWVSSARYLDTGRVIAIDSEGLRIFDGNGDIKASATAAFDAVLAVSPDRKTFCASGHKGELGCFRTMGAR